MSLPPELADIPFSVARALALGVAPARLRRQDLAKPHHGIRVPHPLGDALLDRCRAYAPLLAEGQCFSHETAAELLGVPLPRPARRLDVTSPAPVRAPEGRGIRGRQLTMGSGDRVAFLGLPITSPPLTWLTLAGVLPLADLVAAADSLITSRERGVPPLCTVAELRAAVDARPGARGRRLACAALRLARVGARSRPESLVRVALVLAALPEPLCNLEVRDARGRFLAIVDLAWPEFEVALEYEGDYHRVERGRFHRDINRAERLVDAGWIVIRVSSAALFTETAAMVARVERRLRSRGWAP